MARPLGPPRQGAATVAPGLGNRILGAMTVGERGLVAQMAEPVELAFGATLLPTGGRIEHVVFPDEGLVSLVAELSDGSRAEVGVAGREGLIGLPALLGEPHTPFRAVVQVPGRGHRVGVGALLLLADGSRNLRDLVRRYAMASLVHASFAALCNAAHPLESRAARWLLGVQDRVGPGFPITQEYLAAMLGSRRPTVNAVLQSLKAAGLVRHARGRVAVADRAGLEAAACPCYRAERAQLERLLPKAFG
jgi:CRP-like cAMP-binding protein